MDRLRLWPLTYLNDSLVNFYMKFLVKEKLARVGSPLGTGDFHIFPTYFYSRLTYLESGGTAYRDSQSSRKQLYRDLKGWTKGVDIFEKKFLIFPINYDLHWTFVLVANPGDVLRVIPPPAPPMKTAAKAAAGRPGRTGGSLDNAAAPAKKLKAPSNDENEVVTFEDSKAFDSIASENAGTDIDNRATSSSSNAAPAGLTIVCPDEHDKMPSSHSYLPPGSRSTSASSDEGSKIFDCSGSGGIAHVGPAKSQEASLPENAVAAPYSMTSTPSRAPKSDPTLAPCLIHFDSGKHFKLHRSATIFKHIRKYLTACYESTRSEEFPLCSISAKTLPGFAPPIPQQENAKDCGVYMLEMIERVLCNPLEINASFIEKKGIVEGSPLNNKWFRSADIIQKRLDMLQLIAELEARMYEAVIV